MKQKFLRRPKHPLADIRGNVIQHRMWLYDQLGPGPIPCIDCHTLLDWQKREKSTWQGRLVVVAKNGNENDQRPDNLIACCHGCAIKRTRPDNGKTKYYYEMNANHPLSVKSKGRSVVAVHRRLLYEKIGLGEHLCHWCNTPVYWRNGERTSKGALVADHLDRDPTNNLIENLVVSCHRCNSTRNRTDIVQDDEAYVVGENGWKKRGEFRFCLFCSQKFVATKDQIKRGDGLYCSISCARKEFWKNRKS